MYAKTESHTTSSLTKRSGSIKTISRKVTSGHMLRASAAFWYVYLHHQVSEAHGEVLAASNLAEPVEKEKKMTMMMCIYCSGIVLNRSLSELKLRVADKMQSATSVLVAFQSPDKL